MYPPSYQHRDTRLELKRKWLPGVQKGKFRIGLILISPIFFTILDAEERAVIVEPLQTSLENHADSFRGPKEARQHKAANQNEISFQSSPFIDVSSIQEQIHARKGRISHKEAA
jgi:hypothetical protein